MRIELFFPALMDGANNFILEYKGEIATKKMKAIVVDFVNYIGFCCSTDLSFDTRDLKSKLVATCSLDENAISLLKKRKCTYQQYGITKSVNRNRHLCHCWLSKRLEKKASTVVEDLVDYFEAN